MFDIRITGSQADEATRKLQETTALNLTRDSKTGLLSATGEAKTKSDTALLSAINDHSVEVNLITTDKTSATLTNGGLSGDLVVRAYGGSKVESREGYLYEGMNNPDELVNAPVAVREQFINMNQAGKESLVGGMTAGQNVFHEVIESYFVGKNNPGGIPGPASDVYYKTPIDPKGGARFEKKEIPSNLASTTFHEIGHVIYKGRTQNNVLDYENKARKQTGILPRPYDETHNKTVKEGQYGN